ncbi:MAG: response regulator [Deferribacterales bacterium]
MKKVLLIDDSVTIHRVIDICLDKDRFITEKTFSADDAVMRLKNAPADVILLDNKLESIILGDFISKIRSLAPSSWIILLTGAFDQFDDADLAKSGADDYLFKPFDSQAIELKINYGLSAAPKEAPAEASAPVPAMPEQVITEEQMDIIPPEEAQAEETPLIDLGVMETPEEPAAEEETPAPKEPETAEEEIPAAEDIFTEDDQEPETTPADIYSEEESEDSFPFDDSEPSAAISEEEKAELGHLFDEPGLPEETEAAAMETEAAEDMETSAVTMAQADEQEEDLDSFLKDLEAAHIPEPEIIHDEEEASQEPAAEDFTDLLNELGGQEEPAPEYIIEEEEEQTESDSDPFAGLTMTDEEDALAEPEYKEEEQAESAPEYIIEEEKADEGDIFAGLMHISEDEVIDGRPEEKEQPEEEEIPQEELQTEETTSLDILPEGFLETGEPVDGEILEEQKEPDLSIDALESMPIETDFSELMQADEAELETASEPEAETEPVIVREEEPEAEFPFENEEPLPEPEMAFAEEPETDELTLPEADETAEPEFVTADEAEPAAFEEFPAEQFAPLREMTGEQAEEEAPHQTAQPAAGLAQDEIKEIVYRSLDSGMLKAAIQEVLAEKMEEVLREVLPEIAEMVIREEIERLKRGE